MAETRIPARGRQAHEHTGAVRHQLGTTAHGRVDAKPAHATQPQPSHPGGRSVRVTSCAATGSWKNTGVVRNIASATSSFVRGHSEKPDYYEGKVSLEGPQGLDALVIHPGSRCVAAFDVLVAIAVTYSAVSVPVEVAYRIDGFAPLEALFSAVFGLDMLLQFINGYVEAGYPVLKLEKVALRYAKGWFVVDLVAVIPWERIWSRLMVLKLIKTVRLLRLRRLLAHTKLMAGGNVLRVVLILWFWLLVAHWFACAFFALAWYCCGDPNVYWYKVPATWVTTYFNGERDGPDLSNSCGEEGAPPEVLFIHVRAMHWALASMTSLGYGDSPVPRTTAEFIFSMSTQVVGACLYAAIFSNIARLIEKLDAAGSRFSIKLDKISEFAKFYKLPRALQSKMHRYVSFSFDVDRGFDMHEITAMLPRALQEEVFYNVHAGLVRKVPMFDRCDDAFINQLVRVLRPQVLLKGDFAFKLNDPGDCMYFLKKGAVQISNQNRSIIYCTLMPGSHFGELAMLTAQRRTATATAVTDCIMFYMTSKDFDDVMSDFPSNYNEILDRALERLDTVLRSNTSLEVRMSHAFTKKKLLERQVERMSTRPHVLSESSTTASIHSATTTGSIDSATTTGSVYSPALPHDAIPEEPSASSERAKRAWAELRGVMLFTLRNRAPGETGRVATAKVAPAPEAAKPVLVDHLSHLQTRKQSLPAAVWRDGAYAEGGSGPTTAADAIRKVSSVAAAPLRRMSTCAVRLAHSRPFAASGEGNPTITEVDEGGYHVGTLSSMSVITDAAEIQGGAPIAAAVHVDEQPTVHVDGPQPAPHDSDDSAGVAAAASCGDPGAVGGDPLRMSRDNLDSWKAQATSDMMRNHQAMRLSYHDLARERFAERFAQSQSGSPPQAQAGRSRSCDVPNTRGLGAGDDMGSALAPVSDPWLLEIHSVLRTLLREVQELKSERPGGRQQPDNKEGLNAAMVVE